jgi:hypothetical protein
MNSDWTAGIDKLLLSLIHKSCPRALCEVKHSWQAIADILNTHAEQTGNLGEPFHKCNVTQPYIVISTALLPKPQYETTIAPSA